MTKRILLVLLATALAAVALVAFALPASAELRTFRVRLLDGSIVTVTVDAAPGIPMSQVPGLPGTPIQELTPPSPPPAPTTPAPPSTPTNPSNPPAPSNPQPQQPQGPSGGSSGGNRHASPSPSHTNKSPTPSGGTGNAQRHSGSSTPAPSGGATPQAKAQPQAKGRRSAPSSTTGLGQAPAAAGTPNFFDTLPGPTGSGLVPSFVINNFRVPLFLLPIYQAAGIQYGIRWEVLAAINEIETNYGRDLSVSTAGAVGWMQFMPATWRQWGVDATGDGVRDPYNPVDAIFAAARYLKAAHGDKDIRGAVFAYNHATWYVDSVMLRADLLAGYPADFIASLTGLTDSRYPVAGRSHYKRPIPIAPAPGSTGALATATQQFGSAAAGLTGTGATTTQSVQRYVDIFARRGTPVIATNDGIIKAIGRSPSLGRFVKLQDVYGNQFTYAHLGSVSSIYPVPKADLAPTKAQVDSLTASKQRQDPSPTQAATAGVQGAGASQPAAPAPTGHARLTAKPAAPKAAAAAAPVQPAPAFKARYFAHPSRPNPRQSGGAQQLLSELAGGAAGQAAFDSVSASALGLNPHNAILRQLRVGSNVMAGTVLGLIGPSTTADGPHLRFEIQPAGKDAPVIDPLPIMDGWKLLASTNIYRPDGRNALYKSGDKFSIGQVLLLSKAQLQRRVLSDPRIRIYRCGRTDIATGQITRRVMATLEYLAGSGLYPTVSALKCGHTGPTTPGTVSEHASGNAFDITAINGTPIRGNQQPGGIAEQAIRRMMLLQGNLAPNEIVSQLALGANTLAMPDHADRIQVGFKPLFGDNVKLGQQATSILKRGQWDSLISHLSNLPNPVVPTRPSKYALPDSGGNTGLGG